MFYCSSFCDMIFVNCIIATMIISSVGAFYDSIFALIKRVSFAGLLTCFLHSITDIPTLHAVSITICERAGVLMM